MKSKILPFTFLFSLLFFNTYFSYSKTNDLKNYKFNISGKITYDDKSGYTEGLYGSKVVLYMLRKSDGEIEQPTGIGLYPKDLQTSIKPDGSFSLDIEMLSNLDRFDRIFLEIHPGDSHGLVHYNGLQFIIQTSAGKTTVWNKQIEGEPFRGIAFTFTKNQTKYEFKNMQVKVMANFGAVSRYLKISSEFGKFFFAQLGRNISIPPIGVVMATKITDAPSHAQGAFFSYNGPARIQIKSLSPMPYGDIMAHEYGHYIHYLLNHDHYKHSAVGINDYEKRQINITQEAVADFFLMAIKSYSVAIYNTEIDKIPNYSYDNYEKIPFNNPAFSGCSYCGDNDIPHYAAYLWNMYDGPSQTFNQPGYVVNDNDDIDGGKENFYKDVFNDLSHYNIRKNFSLYAFFETMKKKASSELNKSLTSMQRFLFEYTKDVMLPPQVNQAKLTINPDGKTYRLNLKTYAYSKTGDSKKDYYKNFPDGYKLYAKNGNKSVLIPFNGNAVENNNGEIVFSIISKNIGSYKDFKVTSYNESGESLHPFNFTHKSLNVTIEGPQNVYADQNYDWKASVTNGNAPYTYVWRMKNLQTQQYYGLPGTQGSKQVFNAKAHKGEDFTLDLFVSSNDGLAGRTTMQVYTTVRPLKANIQGVGVVAANENNIWQSEVTGGVPPYAYTWRKEVAGIPYPIFLGQSKSCDTKTEKSFVLKLKVKDALNNEVNIEKPIQLNASIFINAIISGDKIIYLHKNTSSWKVDVTGGKPPYQIDWVKKYEGEEGGFDKVASGTSYENDPYGKQGVFYLKTVVKDANGVIKESAPFKVTAIYQPLYLSFFKPAIVVKAGEKVNWIVNIDGGRPDFKYQWQCGSNIGTLKVLEQGSVNNGITSYNYQTKVTDAGKYVMAITVTDVFNKSMTIYHDFTVENKINIDFINKNSQITTPDSLQHFNIYPNPATGSFTINYTLQEEADIAISLVAARDNIETRLYQQQSIKGLYQKRFNTMQFQPGAYFVKLTKKGKNGRVVVSTEKIVLLR